MIVIIIIDGKYVFRVLFCAVCGVDVDFHAASNISWLLSCFMWRSLCVCERTLPNVQVALQYFVIPRLTIDVKIVRINYDTIAIELHENHELTSNYILLFSLLLPFVILL